MLSDYLYANDSVWIIFSIVVKVVESEYSILCTGVLCVSRGCVGFAVICVNCDRCPVYICPVCILFLGVVVYSVCVLLTVYVYDPFPIFVITTSLM